MLRAFKPLFDASLEELSKNESIGEAIPISMVIQLIISRSPKDLKSPFQVADWTPRTRYQPTLINLFFIYTMVVSLRTAYANPIDIENESSVVESIKSQYSQWLDEHESEKERLSLLKGTIENYTKSVQKKGKSEFVSELPIIMDLLKRGLAA